MCRQLCEEKQQGGAAGSAQRLLRQAVQRNGRGDDEDFQDQGQDWDLDGGRIVNPSRAGQAGDGVGAAEAEPDQ